MASNDCGICGLLPAIADMVKDNIAHVTGRNLDFALVILEPVEDREPHFISNENPAEFKDGLLQIVSNIEAGKYQKENA